MSISRACAGEFEAVEHEIARNIRLKPHRVLEQIHIRVQAPGLLHIWLVCASGKVFVFSGAASSVKNRKASIWVHRKPTSSTASLISSMLQAQRLLVVTDLLRIDPIDHRPLVHAEA